MFDSSDEEGDLELTPFAIDRYYTTINFIGKLLAVSAVYSGLVQVRVVVEAGTSETETWVAETETEAI